MLVDTLLNLLHLLAVSALRFLPLIVLLDGLKNVSTADSSVLVQIFGLRIIGQLLSLSLWVRLLSGEVFYNFGSKVFGCEGSFLLVFVFLWFVKLLGGGVKLLIFCLILHLPLFPLPLPDSQGLPACTLHRPNLVSG